MIGYGIGTAGVIAGAAGLLLTIAPLGSSIGIAAVAASPKEVKKPAVAASSPAGIETLLSSVEDPASNAITISAEDGSVVVRSAADGSRLIADQILLHQHWNAPLPGTLVAEGEVAADPAAVQQLLAQHNAALATRSAAEALRQAPGDVALSRMLLNRAAAAHRLRGRYEQAGEFYRQAIALPDDNATPEATDAYWRAVAGLADINVMQGDHAHAAELYKLALEANHGVAPGELPEVYGESLMGLAGAYAKMGQLEEAQAIYERALAATGGRLPEASTPYPQPAVARVPTLDQVAPGRFRARAPGADAQLPGETGDLASEIRALRNEIRALADVVRSLNERLESMSPQSRSNAPSGSRYTYPGATAER